MDRLGGLVVIAPALRAGDPGSNPGIYIIPKLSYNLQNTAANKCNNNSISANIYKTTI